MDRLPHRSVPTARRLARAVLLGALAVLCLPSPGVEPPSSPAAVSPAARVDLVPAQLPDVDLDAPELALATGDGGKALGKLLKRLGKAQKRFLEACGKQVSFQTKEAATQSAVSFAEALPEDTPKALKAKTKTLKGLSKTLKKVGKRVSKWTNKVAKHQARIDELTIEIDKLDPTAVPPAQELVLEPGSLVFATEVGASAPPAQAALVRNTGDVSMDWSIAADASWVVVTPSSGTLPGGGEVQVAVGVDAMALTTGTYLATLTADAPQATNLVEPSLAAALSVVPPPVQSGLLGEYFDDTQLTDFVQTRLDPNVDFTTWGAAPTGTAVLPDSEHSERWTGWVSISRTGPWRFFTVSNDGVRLWIDDTLVIDNWTAHSATEDEAEVELTAGWRAIRMEHFQSDGSVVAQLLFEGPGQKKAVIPPDDLRTFQSGNQPPSVDAGPDQQVTLPAGPVDLSGSANDLDGHVVGWSWTQLSGPAATLTDEDTATPTVSGLSSTGSHVFGVTVTDDQGATATDSTEVEVLQPGQGGGAISGELRTWYPLTLDFQGPQTSEAANPNPFRDHRLQVLFTHLGTGRTFDVPGYFAADGNAGETGATSGDVWRARFVPDAGGTWSYSASFRTGPDVATSLSPTAGTPGSFDGATGTFVVAPPDPSAPGFRAEGRLVHAGDHHLRFAGSGRAFLQGGADSPENLLAFGDFDQTPASHAYLPHVGDWQPGDPTWQGGKGKGLVGAMNYLAGKGMNSVYFLTYNAGGDGDDVWMFVDKTTRDRYDCSKLAQWEVVFDHMDALGLQLHVVTQEQENDNGTWGLDGGVLGPERKLYYRELVARFGHHLGVVWNLGEENTNTNSQRRDFHDRFEALDPYGHPITVHTYPEQHQSVYGNALDWPILHGATLQNQTVDLTHGETLLWRDESVIHGQPWVVTLSEFGPSSDGVVPDAVDYWHDDVRKDGLWGNLMAGGGGVEWYFGYGHAHSDLTCEDWRSRDHMWELTDIALDFFQAHLPFWAMTPDDTLVTNPDGWCLAQPGQVYAVYLRSGGTTKLDLGAGGATYTVRWYDPRLGGALQTGDVTSVSGAGFQSLGQPPHSPTQDWAVLVERAP